MSTGAYSASIDGYGEAINQAGRQRMLSQRMVKAFAQIGLQIWYAKPRKQLKKALQLYQTQLENLKGFAKSSNSRKALSRVETVWKKYKVLASGRVSQENAVKFNQMSEQLLQASQKVVEALVDEAKSEKAHIVDISGRQRMLSQRMAKFYLLMSWGLVHTDYQSEFKKAEQEFSQALLELKASSLNTTEISEALQKVDKQWRFFQLTKIMDEDQYLPYIVARTTESLLQDMNRITGMYAKRTTGNAIKTLAAMENGAKAVSLRR
ncbi:MAG: type IV pili methyl-accepting chemotaxis transducer N-terminal domain-containing protein [Candidatus Thiodiazotropha sp. (ex Dulcina madagascariensis)]|nr:type IV pili methyl-accepting chemotaxis transducer N-terminal domain-containing protein [Candidatus Thiodiazotropha sp. (ex Dulcina madagascariensis)]